jgi:hypothetical protein
MCLPVSRLFWVLSLAYPNLLGTKDYVVVVVVVLYQIPHACPVPILIDPEFSIVDFKPTLLLTFLII